MYCRTAQINNLQKQEEEKLNNSLNNNNNQTSTSPLKDNSNIRQPRQLISENGGAPNTSTTNTSSNNNYIKSNKRSSAQSSTSSSHTTTTAPKLGTTTTGTERPLKCLETLAQKAGITFDEKYEAANTLITLEKSQSPAQQVAVQGQQNLQISHEQLQQLQQQLQLQQAFGGNAVQVKQEFPNQQTLSMADLKQLGDPNHVHQVQQMQLIDASTGSPQQHPPHSQAMGMQNQQTTTTMTTMSPLQLQGGQVPGDWTHGRVQVVQQPLQNQQYLQQLYSPQVIMPGNILHPGLGQQPIQVITAGKPFQGGQITQQMLATAQGKQMMGNGATGFGGTYTLPTSQSQTLLFSPVNVLSSQPQQQQQQQQQNLVPMNGGNMNQNTPNKTQQDLQKTFGQKVLQKVGTTVNAAGQNITNVTNQQQQSQQCVQVSQAMPTAQLINQIPQSGAQQMQFAAPWLQSATVPQFWTANGLQSQTTMLAPNSFLIRSTQPDGTQGMFIQHNPQAAPQSIQPAQQQQQQTQQIQVFTFI